MKYLIAIALLCTSVFASAEMPLQLVRVNNTRLPGMTAAEVEQTMAVVQEYYRNKLKINSEIKRYLEYRDYHGYGLNIQNGYSHIAFSYWYNKLKRERQFDRAITVVIMPPMYDEEKYYYYGGSAMQQSAGMDDAFAMSFCGHSVPGCSLITAHEVGHVIGMHHLTPIRNGYEVPNLMHPAASRYGSMVLLHRSRAQARRYLRSVALWDEYRE